MALETGTYISDLVATNPTSGDPLSQSDDHLRLLKSTIQATFPSVTGAVTGTHTAINDAVQRVLTSGTFVSASGASIDFTSIPSWVKRITINVSSLSTNGTSNYIVQIGGSGGIETSGYISTAAQFTNGASPLIVDFSTGYGITGSISAAASIHGSIVLSLRSIARSQAPSPFSPVVVRRPSPLLLIVSESQPLAASIRSTAAL
jgi:hypothetical protein